MASMSTTLMYRDPKAAMAWLRDALDFETSILLTDDDGNIAHCEMAYGECRVGVAGEWTGPQLGGARMVSPASLDGRCTQFLWIALDEPLDQHCARARAAGAQIAQEPEDQFYGDRTYRVRDLDGHIWCFSQTIAEVSNAEMEARSGLKVEKGGQP